MKYEPARPIREVTLVMTEDEYRWWASQLMEGDPRTPEGLMGAALTGAYLRGIGGYE